MTELLLWDSERVEDLGGLRGGRTRSVSNPGRDGRAVHPYHKHGIQSGSALN